MLEETKAKQKSFFVGYNIAKKKFAVGRRNDKPITTMTLLERNAELEKQNKKAKEIIKKFLLWENDWHKKTESKYELLKQAETFLSEVTK